ncbi:hypothetical protein LMG18095_04720 [Ralstonia thomasii]|uniref:Uncharacterized protein n=1 Tax=Ralstonia thomasii TaxID=3058596 RepID=A0ABM9JZ65_9RALS|nr:hypothetical protein LMG18095_04720 [Ralstonia sp. LMG 18095]
MAYAIPMTVTLDSRATFWFLVGGARLYTYALFSL